MPLVRIHVIKGRRPDELERLLDVIHETVVESFKVPLTDRYQILHEHAPSHFRALDTGLEMERTPNFVLVDLLSRPRTRRTKLSFYKNLTRSLQERCHIEPSDVMITLLENSDYDWSFGLGRAQFVTGELGAPE